MSVTEIGLEGVTRIKLAKDRVQGRLIILSLWVMVLCQQGVTHCCGKCINVIMSLLEPLRQTDRSTDLICNNTCPLSSANI